MTFTELLFLLLIFYLSYTYCIKPLESNTSSNSNLNSNNMAFKSNVDSVNLTLSFEIDENAGQEELNYFGYGYTKDGRCMSLIKDKNNPNEERQRVGRFPSQAAYEAFGLALENYIFWVLKNVYKMNPHTTINDDSSDDDTDNNENNENENEDNDIDTEIKDKSENTKEAETGTESTDKENNTEKEKTNINENETDNDNKSNDKNEENEKNDKNEETKDTKSNSNDKSNDKNEESEKTEPKSEKKQTKPKKMKIRATPQTIFTSPGYETKKTLLLLVPGSGAVRAGQWARSICINDNLASGTMFPFIDCAYERDWGVVLFDPNGRDLNNNRPMFSDGHVIQGYNQFVAPLIYKDNKTIENLLIVCHSAGGGATSRLLGGNIDRSKEEFSKLNNILAAGTDTWFISPPNGNGKNNRNKIYEVIYHRNIVNWKTSNKKGDTMLQNSSNPYYNNNKNNKNKNKSRMGMGMGWRGFGMNSNNGWREEQRSCGHRAHEYSSASAFPYIFKFFDARLDIKKLSNPNKNIKGKRTEKATNKNQENDKMSGQNENENDETKNNEMCKDDKNETKNNMTPPATVPATGPATAPTADTNVEKNEKNKENSEKLKTTENKNVKNIGNMELDTDDDNNDNNENNDSSKHVESTEVNNEKNETNDTSINKVENNESNEKNEKEDKDTEMN